MEFYCFGGCVISWCSFYEIHLKYCYNKIYGAQHKLYMKYHNTGYKSYLMFRSSVLRDKHKMGSVFRIDWVL